MRFVVLSVLALCGCAQLPAQEPGELEQLRTELAAVKANLALSSTEMAALKAQENAGQSAMGTRLEALQASLDTLAEDVQQQHRACTSPPPAAECEAGVPAVIVSPDTNKMVLGEVEHVWMDPPGLQVVARMDTGASSSSLHASNITAFERDGDDWVRFEVTDEETTRTVERPVAKYVRVFQQADKEGSRRPVVEMRLRLGDVQDTFEFTLADRSHLEHGMILGRNFLTDMALVDVSRQFVQPAFTPTDQD